MNVFIRPLKVPDPIVRLVVFHHAGGSAAAYHPLARALPPDWDVLLFDLPGHGRRYAEPLVRDMARLTDAAARDLAPHVLSDETPYAMFGHSMGALVAVEVARRFTEGRRPPVWVGVSGRAAPLAHWPNPRWSGLPDEQLSAVLMGLGGTPERIREEPELHRRFLQLARADLESLESYTVDPDRTRLSCPLSAFGGLTDPSAPPVSLPAWEQETTGRYGQCFLPGGHFYFFDAFPALAREIRCEVRPVLDRVAAAARG